MRSPRRVEPSLPRRTSAIKCTVPTIAMINVFLIFSSELGLRCSVSCPKHAIMNTGSLFQVGRFVFDATARKPARLIVRSSCRSF